jgi:hypothetical protein
MMILRELVLHMYGTKVRAFDLTLSVSYQAAAAVCRLRTESITNAYASYDVGG